MLFVPSFKPVLARLAAAQQEAEAARSSLLMGLIWVEVFQLSELHRICTVPVAQWSWSSGHPKMVNDFSEKR